MPVADREGREIIAWRNHYGYLRKFVRGKEKIHPTTREVETFGKMLGRLHSVTEGYRTKQKRNHVWDVNQTRKYFTEDKNVLLKSSFRDKKAFVQLVEQTLTTLHFPRMLPSGMLHEDLGKRHVLWNGERIAAIIDFDRSYYGALILDLGQAMRGWCFTRNWRAWSDGNAQALLKGYESKRLLAQLERKCLRDAIQFAIVERAISFALRYVQVTRDPDDEKFAWDSIKTLLPMVDAVAFDKR